VLFTGVLGRRRVVGVGCVFFRVLIVGTLIMSALFVGFGRMVRRRGGGFDGGRIGQGHCRQRLARMNMLVMFVIVFIVNMFMIVRVFMMLVIVMLGMIIVLRIGMAMFGVVGVTMIAFGMRAFDVILVIFLALRRLSRLRRIGGRVLDDLALDALAIAAAARVAVARTAAVGAVFGFFLGLAMGAFVRLDQRLAIGDRNLIVVRVDFAEGEEAVTVAAIFDEGRLQRRLYARDLGEVDVAAQLLALGGLEIKLFDAIAADHDYPGLFRVGGIDQHFVGHFGTLDGGGRV
jgi:hypothetical protein